MAGMKGRPPTPKHILQLRGSKHAKNREELGTKPTSMEPPPWLKPRAKEIFGNVVEWMERMGTLAESDGNVITRYAVVYTQWEFAAQKLQELDLTHVEVTNNDGSLRFTRACGVAAQAKDCGDQLRHLEAVLGLTPSDRTRLGYNTTKVEADPAEELFNKRSG